MGISSLSGRGGGGGGIPPIVSNAQPVSAKEGLLWLNPNTNILQLYINGGFRGLGNPTIGLTRYTNTVTLAIAASSFNHGVTSFNKNIDILLVHKAGVLLQEGVEWQLSPDGLSIQKLSSYDGASTWPSGTIFDILSIASIPTSNMFQTSRLSNLVTITSNGTTNISIGIAQYNPTTDVLDVVLLPDNTPLIEGVNYNLNANNTSIDLLGPNFSLNTNDQIMFRVWKQVRTTVGAMDGSLLVDNTISDNKIGSRTADPTQVPTGNVGKLNDWLSWLTNRVNVIQGTTNWYDAPAVNLANALSKTGGGFVQLNGTQSVGVGSIQSVVGFTSTLPRFYVTDEINFGFAYFENNNNDGPILRLYRALGNSATPAAVTANQSIGGIRGFGYTGAAYSSPSATIELASNEAFTSTANGSYMYFRTTLNGTTSPIERMRIDHLGNLGLGTITSGVSATSRFHQVAGGFRLQGMSFATSTFTATAQGTTGSTSITYYITGKDANGNRSQFLGATVSNATATQSAGSSVLLSWTAFPGAVSYDILKGGYVNSIATNVTGTSFTDNGQATVAYSPPMGDETSTLNIDGGIKVQATNLPVASYRLVVQDGTGRVNEYWNTNSYPGGHTYQSSGEPAGRWVKDPNGGIFQVLYASAGTAGGTITWQTLLNVYNNKSVSTYNTSLDDGNGNIILKNNAALQANETGGGGRTLAYMDASNIVRIGDNSNTRQTLLQGSSIVTRGNTTLDDGLGTPDFWGNSYGFAIGDKANRRRITTPDANSFNFLTDGNGWATLNVGALGAAKQIQINGGNISSNRAYLVLSDTSQAAGITGIYTSTIRFSSQNTFYWDVINYTATNGSYTASSDALAFYYGGTGAGSKFNLYGNGNATFIGAVTATSFPTSSDLRFKTNIKTINNPLQKIEAIRGVTYEWNDHYRKVKSNTHTKPNQVGVIAQEVEDILPQAIHEDSDGYKSVDYSRLVPLLIEAIKELNKKVKILESKKK